MSKLNIAVLLALFYLCIIPIIEAKKYYADNLPPIKIGPINNVIDLFNGGPLNLNQAKLIKDKESVTNKSKIDNKTIIESNEKHHKSSEHKNNAEANESIDSSKFLFAVGSNFSNLAVLVPANLSVLQKSNIHPQHIIGYVPLRTPNGQAIVLPAGAVRVFNERQLLNHNEIRIDEVDDESIKTKAALRIEEDYQKPEGREVRNRKLIRIYTSKGRLRRNRRRRNNDKSGNHKRRRYNKKRLRRKLKNPNKWKRKTIKIHRLTKRRKNSIT